jgi:hypothetical protein
VKHAVLAATLTPFGSGGALALERLPAYLEQALLAQPEAAR